MQIERTLDHRSIPALIADLQRYDKRWFCFGRFRWGHSSILPEELLLHGLPWQFVNAEHDLEHNEVAITFDDCGNKRVYHCRLQDKGLLVRHNADTTKHQPRGWKRLGFVAVLTDDTSLDNEPTIIERDEDTVPASNDKVILDHSFAETLLASMCTPAARNGRFCFVDNGRDGPSWRVLTIKLSPGDDENAACAGGDVIQLQLVPVPDTPFSPISSFDVKILVHHLSGKLWLWGKWDGLEKLGLSKPYIGRIRHLPDTTPIEELADAVCDIRSCFLQEPSHDKTQRGSKPWPRWIRSLVLLAVMVVAYNADWFIEMWVKLANSTTN